MFGRLRGMHALRALFLRIGGRKSCSEMRGEEEVMKPLVTVSREYGSGGRIIGAKIAERLGVPILTRSEERRVGKECRSRWSPYH